MGVIYVCGVVNVCCEYIKGKLMCYEVLRWARGYVLGAWFGWGGGTDRIGPSEFAASGTRHDMVQRQFTDVSEVHQEGVSVVLEMNGSEVHKVYVCVWGGG